MEIQTTTMIACHKVGQPRTLQRCPPRSPQTIDGDDIQLHPLRGDEWRQEQEEDEGVLSLAEERRYSFLLQGCGDNKGLSGSEEPGERHHEEKRSEAQEA